MIGIRVLALMLALALPSGVLGQSMQVAQTQDRDLSFLSGETSVASQIDAKSEGTPTDGGDSGPAVDASGDQAADPSKNVLDLQRAATQRQDDLRVGSERYLMLLLEANKEMDELRFEMASQLRSAESRRLDNLIDLRADYEQRLAAAEAQRIDAIRAVDVNATQNATERAVETAGVLSNQLVTTAEQNRALVSSTEQSLAASQRQSFMEFSNRITALEQSQSFGQGRQTVSDPALVMLADEVKKLASAQSVSTGQDTGSAATIAFIFAGIGALVGVIGIIGSLIAVFVRRPPTPALVNGNGPPNGYYTQKAQKA